MIQQKYDNFANEMKLESGPCMKAAVALDCKQRTMMTMRFNEESGEIAELDNSEQGLKATTLAWMKG